MQRLNQADLTALHVTFDQMVKQATDALLRRPPPSRSELQKGTYRFDGDDYAATQFLLGALWKDASIRGDPVAVFIATHTVLLTGSEDTDGIRRLLSVAEKEQKEPRAWTPRVLHLNKDAWESFQVGKNAAIRDVLEGLALRGFRADYDLQTEALDRWVSSLSCASVARDEDAFPAKALLAKSKASGLISTLTTLTQGVDSTLPEVDWVGLVQVEHGTPKVLGMVPMTALKQTLGTKMTKTRFWPTRYRVSNFPTTAQLSALNPSRELP
jgi:hypothetical protein